MTAVCQFGPIDVEYDQRVLTPRLWTLAQSRWAAELAAQAPPGPMLELCAGAGHIGLAAAVLSDRELVQVEADPVAAGFARANAERAGRGARVEIRTGRLQTAVEQGETFAVILADPPYLPSEQVQRWPADPVSAIDGGADGLDLVKACLAVGAAHLADGGHLLLQVAGHRQAQEVRALAPDSGLTVAQVQVADDERAVVLLQHIR